MLGLKLLCFSCTKTSAPTHSSLPLANLSPSMPNPFLQSLSFSAFPFPAQLVAPNGNTRNVLTENPKGYRVWGNFRLNCSLLVKNRCSRKSVMERAKEAARGQTLLAKGRTAELCQLGLRRKDHMSWQTRGQTASTRAGERGRKGFHLLKCSQTSSQFLGTD